MIVANQAREAAHTPGSHAGVRRRLAAGGSGWMERCAACAVAGGDRGLDAEAQRHGASWLKGKQLAKNLAAA